MAVQPSDPLAGPSRAGDRQGARGRLTHGRGRSHRRLRSGGIDVDLGGLHRRPRRRFRVDAGAGLSGRGDLSHDRGEPTSRTRTRSPGPRSPDTVTGHELRGFLLADPGAAPPLGVARWRRPGRQGCPAATSSPPPPPPGWPLRTRPPGRGSARRARRRTECGGERPPSAGPPTWTTRPSSTITMRPASSIASMGSWVTRTRTPSKESSGGGGLIEPLP